MLRTAALGWRQERLTINSEEISRLGRELYDRARSFTERFDTLGTRLDATVRAYNDAVGAYDARVMVSMRKFKELGAATGDAIEPPTLGGHHAAQAAECDAAGPARQPRRRWSRRGEGRRQGTAGRRTECR